MTIMVNFEDRCCLCLGENKPLVGATEADNTALLQDVIDCFGIKITEEDGLPKTICASCMAFLKKYNDNKMNASRTRLILEFLYSHS